MIPKKKGNFKLPLSIFIIFVISIASFQLLLENETYSNYKGHGLSYVCLAIVGLVGFWGWFSYQIKWPRLIWALTYVIVELILFLFKAIEIFIHKIPGQYWGGFLHLQAFFISPFPFLVLYFIVKKISKNNIVSGITDN